LGRQDVPKTVNNILRYCIKHELALHICYTSNSGKIPFEALQLTRVIRGNVFLFTMKWNVNLAMYFKEIHLKLLKAVHETPHQKPTTDEIINSCIAKWFQNSIDRKGGIVDRAKKAEYKTNGDTTTIAEEKNSEGSQ